MKIARLILLWACLVAWLAAPAANRNVVMFVTDDQGLDAGCYGNRVLKTPNLDRLAAGGVRFNHAFCTTSSCSASRSVILSGLINHANGQYGHEHAYHHFRSFDWVQSLPVLLSKAGYRTCRIGKYHVGPEPVYHFDVAANQALKGGARSDVQMAENAEEFIRECGDQPFFVYFCTSDPHRAGKGFANGSKYPGIVPVKYDPKDISVPPFLPDWPDTRKDLAEYYEAISRADQGLGRLLQAIESTGHSGDTLFLYLSDNGSPWPGAKSTLYEAGMRLPLVVRLPGASPKGAATDAMVTWADLTPTILEYAGAAGPKYPLHGRSFLSVLKQPDQPGWDEVYASHTFHEITMYYPMRAIRTRRYKYILNLAHQLPYPFASDLYDSPTWQAAISRGEKMFGARSLDTYIHRPRHELYNLEADPQELHNLAERPEQQALLKDLQRRLRAWQEKTKDPWVVKYEYE